MKKGDIVKVVWLDPQTNAGWIEERGHLEPVTTVGFFLDNANGTLRLADTYHSGTEEYADELLFPSGCVLHIEVIVAA
jgi:hypothetical protein